MLCEASSVIKAIEEAWDKSGKPVEFTVKILEQGKKGFLWFGGEPTIISFAYEPKKQPTQHADRQKHTTNNQSGKKKQQPATQTQKVQHTTKQQPAKAQALQKQTPQPQRTQTKDVIPQDVMPQKAKPIEPKIIELREAQESINHWNQEFVENISKNLDDLCAILAITTPYTTHVDNRKLHITFEKQLLNASDEKMLFISLSYLLMQFVKKQFKKKFRGFHLILKSKDSAAHGDGKVPTE